MPTSTIVPASTAVGLALRRAREARQWTQAQLAEKANTAASSVVNLENGARGLTKGMAGKLSRAFGEDIRKLLNGSANGEAQPSGGDFGILTAVSSDGSFIQSIKMPLDRLQIVLTVADSLVAGGA